MNRAIPFPKSGYSFQGNYIVQADDVIAHTRRIPERGELIVFYFSGGGSARYRVVGVIPGKIALRYAPRTLAEVA